MPYSKECQPIADALAVLEGQQRTLQGLKDAAPGGKPLGLGITLTTLEKKISDKKNELAECERQHPYPQPPANPCTNILSEVPRLQKQISNIYKIAANSVASLLVAGPQDKAMIRLTVKLTSERASKEAAPLQRKVEALREEYIACIIRNHGLLALDAKFDGTATTLTSYVEAAGSYVQNVSIGVHFCEWNHADITVTDFPPMSMSFDTGFPAGIVTTTVTMNSGFGKYDPQTKFVSLNLDLHFAHSTSLAGPSNIDIVLRSASPVGTGGELSASGAGRFQGGFLDGYTATVEIIGAVQPIP